MQKCFDKVVILIFVIYLFQPILIWDILVMFWVSGSLILVLRNMRYYISMQFDVKHLLVKMLLLFIK